MGVGHVSFRLKNEKEVRIEFVIMTEDLFGFDLLLGGGKQLKPLVECPFQSQEKRNFSGESVSA